MNAKCGGVLFFFFSSRRRHTRLQGDWSSDVCSSDLGQADLGSDGELVGRRLVRRTRDRDGPWHTGLGEFHLIAHAVEVGFAHEAVQRRSEEHTSELQSPCNLVCRLLLEKKKATNRAS